MGKRNRKSNKNNKRREDRNGGVIKDKSKIGDMKENQRTKNKRKIRLKN